KTSNCLPQGRVVRTTNINKNKYKYSRPYVKKQNYEFYDNSRTSSRQNSNVNAGVRAANISRLEKFSQLQDLQYDLLVDGNSMTPDEKKKMQKQLNYLVRTLRTYMGRSQDFPFFSEMNRLDQVALSLVGKKTAYSTPGMTAEDILKKIQAKQYLIFEESLPLD
ncbi:MAG: hypothetical protein IKB77_02220, partial [Lentisphaeria bacterium]|nr:hypothetical protein [Lentisphaeria bacterium]